MQRRISKRQSASAAAWFVMALVLSGCVTNAPIGQQVPAPGYVPANQVLVAVVDERDRVKNGKPKTFIGVAHGVFGIPTDWNVDPILAVEPGDKERDLSQFLQNRLTRGLVDKGWHAVEASFSTAPDDQQVQQKLTDTGSRYLLLLRVHEWYFSINLNWVGAFNLDTDTDVSIYRVNDGNVLTKRIAGRDVIDEKASESPRNMILMAYRDQLAEIVNDPDVERTLEAQ